MKLCTIMFLFGAIILIGGCAPQAGNTESNVNGNTIEMTSDGFSHGTLTIKAGDTVTFINKDSGQHWPASAVHPTHAAYDGTSLSEHCPDGNSFDACRGLENGEEYSYKFEKTGTWKYHDHLRPGQAGTIVVQ